MITPNKLIKGQTIGIYSPSASIKIAQSRIDLCEKGISAIEKYGFTVKKGNCFNKSFFHMSAKAKERADEIHQLFLDTSVSAIFPTIGGHTASQILPYLDMQLIKSNPKIFLGFSDSSLLASYITEKTGLVTFHSVCDIAFGFGRLNRNDNPMKTKGDFSTKSLWNTLTNKEYLKDKFTEWTPLIEGESTGILIGGNIKGIQSLIGTPYEPKWEGKILYWEAMDQPHAIMQSFVHLINAGVINKIEGLIIGKVSHLKDNFYNENEWMKIADFIKYMLNDIKIPVIIDADIGHDIENTTIPNGLLVRLHVTSNSAEVTPLLT